MIARWLPKRKKSLCTPVDGRIVRNLSGKVRPAMSADVCGLWEKVFPSAEGRRVRMAEA
jgi:hypothetical protein